MSTRADDFAGYSRVGSLSPTSFVTRNATGDIVGMGQTQEAVYECDICGALVIHPLAHLDTHEEDPDA